MADSGGGLWASECPICLGEFVDGEKVWVLPKCYHDFYVTCIDKWLLSYSLQSISPLGNREVATTSLSQANWGRIYELPLSMLPCWKFEVDYINFHYTVVKYFLFAPLKFVFSFYFLFGQIKIKMSSYIIWWLKVWWFLLFFEAQSNLMS